MSRICAAVLSLAVAVHAAPAADFNMDVKTEGIRLGESVMGAKLDGDALKGRVVMLEFWGINCKPCLTSMPHVARLNDELSGFGLVVVAAHAQNGTPEKIRYVARSRGANFSVVENARVAGADDIKGIPHSIIFDHTGKCVYRGHPMQAEATLRETLGKAIAAKFKGSPVKPVASVLDSLRKGQAPAGALQKAITLSKGADKAAAAQAKELIDAMTEPAVAEFALLQRERSIDPVTVLPRLARFKEDLKGTPTGAKSAELLSEMKKDKVVQAELKARPSLDVVRKVDSVLQDVAGDKEVRDEAFQKAQANILKQMTSVIKTMKKTWPDAPSTAEALEIAERYGLKVTK